MRKSTRHNRIAICYDFDLTLSTSNMQEYTIIPSFDIDKDKFWTEVKEYTIENKMDNNLAWMHKLIEYSNFYKKSLKKDYFDECGREIKFFPGVKTWFDNINSYAKECGVEVEHYIISSGLKEIIEGTSIADKFEEIYASSYVYDVDNIACWPAMSVNYTTKTQFIFRIAKGIFDVYDEGVNETTDEEDLHIKYSNIIYIGDSETDIPCMRLVKDKGGFSIGVYSDEKLNKVMHLMDENRINAYAPADYRKGKTLDKIIRSRIKKVAEERELLDKIDNMKEESSLYQFSKLMEEYGLNNFEKEV